MTRVLIGVVVIMFVALLTPSAAVHAASDCDNDKVCETGEAFLSCSDCGIVPSCGTPSYTLGKRSSTPGAAATACPNAGGFSCTSIPITDYSPEHPCLKGTGCEPIGTQKNDCTLCDVVTVVVNVARLILSIVGGTAVVLLLWGAFPLILNFGNAERIESGKKTILHTVLGLVIVLVAWFLVNTLIIVLTNPPGGTQNTIQFLTKPWYKLQLPCE